MQETILVELKKRDIKGSLLITSEGINGTLAGTREAIDELLHYLKTQVVHGELEHKESVCAYQPFERAKVRLKKETISIGEPTDVRNVGTYVSPQGWNALIADPDTIVIDTRNNYEVHLGTFQGAVNPGIRTFKQLPDYVREHLADAKHKKIATFCTGGIRCEKFTSWLSGEGFKNVYHLKGGILKYLEEIPQAESTWQGECFVFDERIAVDHRLEPSTTASRCTACDHTLTSDDRAHPQYLENKGCPHCNKNH
jgi:UPF0176 protein